MSYNEFRLVLAAFPEADLTVFKYEEMGVSVLEDGLYVLNSRLNDEPGFAETTARFVRASMLGWNWAMQNPDAAVDIVLKYDDRGWYDRAYHLYQMHEIIKLLSTNNGRLNGTSYQRTLNFMSTTAPHTFATDAIWGAAFIR